jgi:hypothetical protein
VEADLINPVFLGLVAGRISDHADVQEDYHKMLQRV